MCVTVGKTDQRWHGPPSRGASVCHRAGAASPHIQSHSPPPADPYTVYPASLCLPDMLCVFSPLFLGFIVLAGLGLFRFSEAKIPLSFFPGRALSSTVFPARVLKRMGAGSSLLQASPGRRQEEFTHHRWTGSSPGPGMSCTFLLEWLGPARCTERPCQHRSPRTCNEIGGNEGKTHQRGAPRWGLGKQQDRLSTTA